MVSNTYKWSAVARKALVHELGIASAAIGPAWSSNTSNETTLNSRVVSLFTGRIMSPGSCNEPPRTNANCPSVVEYCGRSPSMMASSRGVMSAKYVSRSS
jgi:hypothetical protein